MIVWVVVDARPPWQVVEMCPVLLYGHYANDSACVVGAYCALITADVVEAAAEATTAFRRDFKVFKLEPQHSTAFQSVIVGSWPWNQTPHILSFSIGNRANCSFSHFSLRFRWCPLFLFLNLFIIQLSFIPRDAHMDLYADHPTTLAHFHTDTRAFA